jgi:hypothetical protein
MSHKKEVYNKVLKALVMKCSMDYVLTWVDVESFIELKS